MRTLSFVLLAVCVLAFSALALTAQDVSWESIRINGDFVNFGGEDATVLAVEEGETLEIRLNLLAAMTADASALQDLEVEAKISGYEYADRESLSDSASVDLVPGTTKPVSLSIELPQRLERDQYLLRLRVLDRNTEALSQDVVLFIEPPRHGLDITDVSFSPGNTVRAGRALLATVLLQNFGNRNENDVKVMVSIPELGVSAVEYIDVDADPDDLDYEDVPEMFLPIPASAAEGEYDVEVTAEFNQFDSVTETFRIRVLADALLAPPQETIVVAAGPESQTATVGSTATYALALSNTGSRSRSFVLETVAGDWATVSLSESLVVLEPGVNRVVYVDVTPTEAAAAGEHSLSVAVKSGNEVLETVTLRTTVAAPAERGVSLRTGLEVALIVLVVLLVIIGLIIGFSRLKKDEEEEQQQYY